MSTVSKYRYGYKVVRVLSYKSYYRDDILGSTFSYCAQLHYGIGSVTLPNEGDGPLAVFATKKDAQSFVREHDSITGTLRIYVCKYVPYKGKRQLWLSVIREGRICKDVSVLDLPVGTRLATEVILTSYVKDYN